MGSEHLMFNHIGKGWIRLVQTSSSSSSGHLAMMTTISLIPAFQNVFQILDHYHSTILRKYTEHTDIYEYYMLRRNPYEPTYDRRIISTSTIWKNQSYLLTKASPMKLAKFCLCWRSSCCIVEMDSALSSMSRRSKKSFDFGDGAVWELGIGIVRSIKWLGSVCVTATGKRPAIIIWSPMSTPRSTISSRDDIET